MIDFSDNAYWLQPSTDTPCIKWPLLGLPPKQPPTPFEQGAPQPDEAAPVSDSSTFTGSVFTEDDNLHLETLLGEFPDVLTVELGRTDVTTHRINTGNAPPYRGPVYRLSADRRQSLRKQLDEMLADGQVEPSCSPWASTMVMVPNKGRGKYRLCVDYRNLRCHKAQHNTLHQ